MHTFAYARPATLAEAVALLAEHGPGGPRPRRRHGPDHPAPRRHAPPDARRRPQADRRAAAGRSARQGGRLVIGATTVMTDIAADERVRRDFAALAEAAAVVGSVQIRNRATLGGNVCNASPAADTAPALLVYGADVVAAGPGGTRRIPLDDVLRALRRDDPARRASWSPRSSCPLPDAGAMGAVHVRRTRRRGPRPRVGHAGRARVDEAGVTRLAYGSVGPAARPRASTRPACSPTRRAPDEAKARDPRADASPDASPSPRSMRAGPEYRLAMLRVLGERALRDRDRAAGGRGSDDDDHHDSHPDDGQRARSRRSTSPPHHTLLDVLRDDLGLTGTKECCLVGECGACTVSLDGRIVDSCLVLAVEADGAEVTTVEGLAAGRPADPAPGGVPRQGRRPVRLLHPGPADGRARPPRRATRIRRVAEIQEGLAGNLCRCGCYEQIIEAVLGGRRGGAGDDRARAIGASPQPRRRASAGSPAPSEYVADIHLPGRAPRAGSSRSPAPGPGSSPSTRARRERCRASAW